MNNGIISEGLKASTSARVSLRTGADRKVQLEQELEGLICENSKLKRQNQKMRRIQEVIYLNCHDHLTGLYNRRFYEEELQRMNNRENLPMALIMGDVNGLKLINDSLGHVMGDALLVKVAELMTKGCRKEDVITRFGGDEFVIILPKTGSDEAQEIIKRMNYLAQKEKVGSHTVSVAFGYAIKADEDENIHEIFKKAEARMYQIKRDNSLNRGGTVTDRKMKEPFSYPKTDFLHPKRVSKLCVGIANAMGLEKDTINQIRLAGLMHDLGKSGIPECILSKPTKLNNAEWEDLRKYSEIGYRALRTRPEFAKVTNYVIEHQEKWDGKGCPKGLKGEEISLQARIISVADAYDAMTGDRSCQTAISKDDAREEIKRCSGMQYDPHVVDAFLTAYR